MVGKGLGRSRDYDATIHVLYVILLYIYIWFWFNFDFFFIFSIDVNCSKILMKNVFRRVCSPILLYVVDVFHLGICFSFFLYRCNGKLMIFKEIIKGFYLYLYLGVGYGTMDPSARNIDIFISICKSYWFSILF